MNTYLQWCLDFDPSNENPGSATLSAKLSASPEDNRLAHLWSAWVMRPSGTCRVRYWSYTHQLIIGMLWISHRPDIKACSHPVFGRIQDMAAGYLNSRKTGYPANFAVWSSKTREQKRTTTLKRFNRILYLGEQTMI